MSLSSLSQESTDLQQTDVSLVLFIDEGADQ